MSRSTDATGPLRQVILRLNRLSRTKSLKLSPRAPLARQRDSVGSVGSGSFDPVLYEQLGQALLRMGDDVQAGRFLFLSGVRRPEYRRPSNYSRDDTCARPDMTCSRRFPQVCAVAPGQRCRQQFDKS